MSRWFFLVPLEASARESDYMQISRDIGSEIQRGPLGSGDVLWGSRTLAKTLGVHFSTVLEAFRRMRAAQ